MPLSDVTIRNARPGERPTKLFDGGGLHLLVNPNGSRLWRLKYRIGGREKLLAIGPYPSVSLKAARSERERAKELLAAGKDPSEVQRLKREMAAASARNTFRGIADMLIERMHKEGRAAVTIDKASWLIAMANDGFGDRPIREITAREILTVLRNVEGAGKLETAKRLRSTISRVFRLAVAHDLAETDPTFALRGAIASPTVTHRAAITNRAELRTLILAIDAYAGQPTTKAALKLLALLVPRPGELRQAEWSEFDLEAGVWSIPASRMKMRRPHRIPIPPSAKEILTDLRAVSNSTNLLFPSIRSSARPISENTLNGALRAMGYDGSIMTSHGFRAGFSTIANESGQWSPDAIERQLAHIDEDAVRRAYARGEYWDERVRLMNWWAVELGLA